MSIHDPIPTMHNDADDTRTRPRARWHLVRLPARRLTVSAVAVATAGAAAVVALGAAPASAVPSQDPADTATYGFAGVGAVQHATVPAGVTGMTVTVRGGQGGSTQWYSTIPGGQGASVTGHATVSPGQVLSIRVGDAGGNGNGTTNPGSGASGAGGNGGGGSMGRNLGLDGAGGGGASSISPDNNYNQCRGGFVPGQPSTIGSNCSAFAIAGGGGGAGGAGGGQYGRQGGAGGDAGSAGHDGDDAGIMSGGEGGINMYSGIFTPAGTAGLICDVTVTDLCAVMSGYGGGGGGGSGYQGGGGGNFGAVDAGGGGGAGGSSTAPNLTNVSYGLNSGQGSVTVTWDEPTYEVVTFDSQGGNFASSVLAPLDGLESSDPTPTKIGYTFLGWFTAPTGGRQWNFATDPVKADMTLYAQWKTALTITSSQSTVSWPTKPMLTATMPVDATGTVQFYDSSTGTLGSVPLVNGKASLTPSWLDAGTNTISASYSGDNHYPTETASTTVTVTKWVTAAPTALTAVPGTRQLTLTWVSPLTIGGSPVNEYKATAVNAITGAWAGSCATVPTGSSPAATTCTITGLTNGTIYYLTVNAQNNTGLSPDSNQAKATPKS